ncbi:hypothetical protein COCON_G00190560 [Conger conger]|uniref:Osteocrin n=1 Tax=Conger conger TaxID=82655 RepID=A0A9Q1D435_CONCO|nr:hypothetical protein COCON_G00190560 [Conger conger]
MLLGLMVDCGNHTLQLAPEAPIVPPTPARLGRCNPRRRVNRTLIEMRGNFIFGPVVERRTLASSLQFFRESLVNSICDCSDRDVAVVTAPLLSNGRNKQKQEKGKREKFWELSVGVCSRVLTEDAGFLRIAPDPPEYLDSAAMEESGARARSGEEKSGSNLAAKLLLLDQLARLENDVIETKKKRSFNGGSIPLDRLSISNMDLKGKQRKVEVPRRRVSVPIDRIGAGRLPSARG